MNNTCLALVPIKWATEWELSNLNGIIYRIVCLINGRSYIGRTKRTFKKRYANKKLFSKSANHYLLHSIKKYGINNFKVQILAYGIRNDVELFALEDFFAKHYNSYVPNGFNIASCGDQSGKHNNGKPFFLRNPMGKIVLIPTWRYLEDLNELSVSALCSLKSGKNLYYKGWSLPETPLEMIKQAKQRNIKNERSSKTYTFQSPSGEIVTIFNFANFARQLGFNFSGFYNAVKFHKRSYKGWKLLNVQNLKPNVLDQSSPQLLSANHLGINDV